MPIPAAVTDLIGVTQYAEEGGFPVEHGYVWTTCAAVENGNPLFWDEDVATAITDGPIAPPTMLSVWFRPHHWSPGRTEPAVPLQAHFDLKAALDLPEAIISSNTNTFHEPVRIGDRVRSRQVLRSVSEPKTTKLGRGLNNSATMSPPPPSTRLSSRAATKARTSSSSSVTWRGVKPEPTKRRNAVCSGGSRNTIGVASPMSAPGWSGSTVRPRAEEKVAAITLDAEGNPTGTKPVEGL